MALTARTYINFAGDYDKPETPEIICFLCNATPQMPFVSLYIETLNVALSVHRFLALRDSLNALLIPQPVAQQIATEAVDEPGQILHTEEPVTQQADASAPEVWF